tara:strand:- start:505 stop:813 length:309 start_codon:yes stop_codon:yes gene_type:complete
MAMKLIDEVSVTTTSTKQGTKATGLTAGNNFVITYFAKASNWGSGSSARLQVSPDGVTWYDVAETIATTDTITNVSLGGGVTIRAVFTAAGSPSGASVWISN